MNKVTSEWERELWSKITMGDGTNCPLYPSCKLRQDGVWCICEHARDNDEIQEFIDVDDPDLNGTQDVQQKASACANNSRIFQLVRRLADKYHEEAGISSIPVPSDIITFANDDLPIEVRYVPLRACHGAVWRLQDCWLIQLNYTDSPARQRFTLYHEIFHILAHSAVNNASFHESSYPRKGYFNELLADYFSASILMPRERLEALWPQVRDVARIAAIFNVPSSIGSLTLTHAGLK